LAAVDGSQTGLEGLVRHPLPTLDDGADKSSRGTLLVVGGSTSTAGAVVLAGLAGLRGGAGKLRVATAQPVIGTVAAAVPEALVAGLPSLEDGTLGASGAAALAPHLADVDAVLYGPGLVGDAAPGFTEAVLPLLEGIAVVVDAGPLFHIGLQRLPLPSPDRSVLTPNRRETAALLGEEDLDEDTAAARAARAYGAVVAVGGTVANVDGVAFRSAAGGPGLATSGSGDVRAGVVAGLLARGAEPTAAAAWGVHAHRVAGDILAVRVAPVGFLARELLDVLPAALDGLGRMVAAAAGADG
jgi:hydroxyethylthiazole kinase-like uncharacterized protein yjeF